MIGSTHGPHTHGVEAFSKIQNLDFATLLSELSADVVKFTRLTEWPTDRLFIKLSPLKGNHMAI